MSLNQDLRKNINVEKFTSVLKFNMKNVPKYLRKAVYWNIQEPWARTLFNNGFRISFIDDTLSVFKPTTTINLENTTICTFNLYIKRDFHIFLDEFEKDIFREYSLMEEDIWEEKEILLRKNKTGTNSNNLVYSFKIPIQRLMGNPFSFDIIMNERPIFLFLKFKEYPCVNMTYDLGKWSKIRHDLYKSTRPIIYSEHWKYLMNDQFLDENSGKMYQYLHLLKHDGLHVWKKQFGLTYPLSY
ncbi:hypothetical protein KMW28_13675 [Flammeovirga yaeyamensis]|uniref:Uncharacterized protein n=1 Tax=Flammeovirga yaeyamensis TaxID=367791 RepID=A0AAX1N2U8_9BACT|nr:hypothetical protein [Flammeovirga yaeyamensis]MBB3700944.1 hypothetical protein [Flammeovirga yaeyamensis]NMF38051.1 hypothetical protein [Flammeovirga yaeyamensis]QWG00701.1 hypothetical protein KMW28_13675 [Flammeovirga yaeyamensis]